MASWVVLSPLGKLHAQSSQKNLTGATRTIQYVGIEQNQTICLVDASTKRARVGALGGHDHSGRRFAPTSTNPHPFLRLKLRELDLWLDESNVSVVSPFLSSSSTKIDIKSNLLAHPHERVDPRLDDIPDEMVPVMRSAIKMFPSSVQSLTIYLGNGQEARLTEEISAFILGCGESLQEFHS